jgi:hypothetical protein
VHSSELTTTTSALGADAAGSISAARVGDRTPSDGGRITLRDGSRGGGQVAYAALLWSAGVACLIVAMLGKAVRIGNIELPAAEGRTREPSNSTVVALCLITHD